MSSKSIASKFNFNNATTDADIVLQNKNIDTVFIATRHDSHAKYVIEALNAGKNVFVEKPLAMNFEELAQIKTAYNNNSGKLMVGYNRRFAPALRAFKKEFSNITEPLIINFTVNAGFIPKDHWTQGSAGGGRIIGEVCHFIDLMQSCADSRPISVYAASLNTDNNKIKNDDNIIITLKFKNGTVGCLSYFANGDKAMPKERLEISGGGKIFCINNFREVVLYNKNKIKKLKATGKGHKQEVELFINSIQEGTKSPINFDSLILTSEITFKILTSLSTNLPVEIE